MKIGYRAQGTGSYTTLGDDTAANGPIITGFVPRMSGIVQVSPLFRAANALVRARDNRSWQLRGTIATQHASAAAAADFIRSQALAIPDFIDIQIIQDGTTIYLTPAVFESFEPLLTGVSSTITYGFVGSNLTATAP